MREEFSSKTKEPISTFPQAAEATENNEGEGAGKGLNKAIFVYKVFLLGPLKSKRSLRPEGSTFLPFQSASHSTGIAYTMEPWDEGQG